MSTEDKAVDRGDDIKLEEKKVVKAEDKSPDADPADEAEVEATADGIDPATAKKAALEDDGASVTDDKKIKIPKSRLDEATRKAREKERLLSEKIAELEEKIKASTVEKPQDPQAQLRSYREKISGLKDKYEELIFDGKKSEAKKVRDELASLEEALADYKIALRADTARSQAEDNMRYNASLAKLEAEHPQLNPDNEDEFSEELTDEVAALSGALTKSGMRPHLALEQAAKYVLGGGKKVAEADAKVKQQRDADARKKAAEADKKQPAALHKAGMDTDKAGAKDEGGIDVMKLNQKQFDKLTDETKARLRGDIV